MRDRAALAPAIQVLTLTVGHGDIFWTPDNWLPESVCDAVRGELRWSTAEVEQLIAITDHEEWSAEVKPAVDFSALGAVLVILAPPPPPDPDAGEPKRADDAFAVRPYK